MLIPPTWIACYCDVIVVAMYSHLLCVVSWWWSDMWYYHTICSPLPPTQITWCLTPYNSPYLKPYYYLVLYKTPYYYHLHLPSINTPFIIPYCYPLHRPPILIPINTLMLILTINPYYYHLRLTPTSYTYYCALLWPLTAIACIVP